jgi:hypothetical protein
VFTPNAPASRRGAPAAHISFPPEALKF